MSLISLPEVLISEKNIEEDSIEDVLDAWLNVEASDIFKG